MRLWQKALHREEWHRWFAWHPVKAGGGLVWLEWIERRRCYAVIDEWWEVRLPDRKEARQKLVAHRTRSERSQTLAPKTLAVYAENRHAAGGCYGADRKVQVPQNALGQDRAADRGRGEAVLVQVGSPEAALA
jgi:hypothetical protein